MSHSAGSCEPDDRDRAGGRDGAAFGFPPATSWVEPEDVIDDAPSSGWGTPGPHLTGPIPRIRAVSAPTESIALTSSGAAGAPPSSTWAPETPAPATPSVPPRSAPPRESAGVQASASKDDDALTVTGGRRGLSSLLEFGFATRGTRSLVPAVYGLVVAYAVLVFVLDVLTALGGVGLGTIALDLLRALLVGGVRLLLTLGLARILCEMALNVLALAEKDG
ncbi:DUF4282 domain-containing protein [Gephyromycinifex aptenodytis]|uniref:DUF4282 domain-containing protein n=1 Tax=Gephyromycinifex aptenodytis TaxID=2716227 RepID=UPI00144568B3|nr:DUF4282 domain-containing protein [Gephyromycinifex aptenodytis]